MSVALPILLLVFGSLTFWLLTESSVKWYFKSACIATFCIFTIVFWSTIHSYLGWPALKSDMPDKVLIHWVIVKEPNKVTKSKGAIYFLIESAEEKKDSWLNVFTYKSDTPEPRLFALPYSRGLHEQIERQIRQKLQRGQPVLGSLSKITKSEKGKAKLGKGESDGKGGGSESQEQDWEFHELRPSDFLNKPND
jgi:hypothetical protein